MTEQTTTHARHEKVLNEANTKLDKGDVRGYWRTLEQISPDYARVAGSVATGSFHGKGARERLQDAAKEKFGRRYSDDELQAIARDIADADHTARHDKLKRDGDAGLTLNDTVEYHSAVFEKNGLPPKTYTLQPLAEAMGGDADAVKDTDPDFVSKNIEMSVKVLPSLGETAQEYAKDTLDAMDREQQQDIRELEDKDPALKENSPFGPHADAEDGESREHNDVADAGSGDGVTDAGAGEDAPKGSGLAVEAARNAAADNASQSNRDETTKTKAKADITPVAPSEESRQKALAILHDAKKQDAPDSLDVLLLKKTEDLTQDEAKALGDKSWRLQSNDPRKVEIENKRADYFSKTYGDDEIARDETGRMIEPQPKRAVPDKPTPLKTPDGETLEVGLKRLSGTLAKALDDEGQTTLVKAVQSGLGHLGETLKVDGISGPKTKAAITRTLARHGTGKAEEAIGLGRFQQFAKAEQDKGGSASALKETVSKTVQPLFGNTPKNVAAEALQETVNDLDAKSAAEKQQPAPQPLKVDGDIGPKTMDAFRVALAQNGPEKLTKSFGNMLGFG